MERTGRAALLTSGEVVGGCWRVDAPLGQGGMGGVFQVTDLRTGRAAALKIMLPGGAARARQARFAREAQVLARITHPGVVRVHASGEHRGMPWFVMELLEGQDLERLVARAGPLEPSAAAALVEQAARAVAACHAAGVIHRDLKPANVIVSPDGAKVIDFGLARGESDDRLTRTGELLGTPFSMAPEQLTGGVVDERADVYALGTVLYLALTGVPVHQASSLPELAARACAGAFTPPRRLRPEVSPALEDVCLHALRPQPGERYATATELADDLARARRGETPRATTASSLRQRLTRREPRALAGLLAALATLLVLGSAGAWFLAVRPAADARSALEAGLAWEQGPLVAWSLGLGPGAAPEPGELDARAAALRAAAGRLGLEDALAARGCAERLEALRAVVEPGGAAAARAPWPLDQLLEARRLRDEGRPVEAAACVTQVLARDPRHPLARRLEALLWPERVTASPRQLRAFAEWVSAVERTEEERAQAPATARAGLSAWLRTTLREAAAAGDEGQGVRATLTEASAAGQALGVDAAGFASLHAAALEAEAEAWASAFQGADPAGALPLVRRLVAATGGQAGPRLRRVVDAWVGARAAALRAAGRSPTFEETEQLARVAEALWHGLRLDGPSPPAYVALVRDVGSSYMDQDPDLSLAYMRLATRRSRTGSTVVRRLEQHIGVAALEAVVAARPDSRAAAYIRIVLAAELERGDRDAAARAFAAATRQDLAPTFLSYALDTLCTQARQRLQQAERSGAPPERLLALAQEVVDLTTQIVTLEGDPEDMALALSRREQVTRHLLPAGLDEAWQAGLARLRARVEAAAGQASVVLEHERRALAMALALAAVNLVQRDAGPDSLERALRLLREAETVALTDRVAWAAITVHLARGALDEAEQAAQRGLAAHVEPCDDFLEATVRSAVARGDAALARSRLVPLRARFSERRVQRLEAEIAALEAR